MEHTFHVGDKVKVRQGVPDNVNGAVGVRAGDTGIVLGISGWDIRVEFDRVNHLWFIQPENIEVIHPERPFKAGDVVRILPNNYHPYGTTTNSGDIGIITQAQSTTNYWIKFAKETGWFGHSESFFELCPKQIAYKEVRIKDGQFVSIRAGEYDNGKQVTYRVGDFIYSPTEKGLFCYLNRETALADTKKQFNFPITTTSFKAALLKVEGYGELKIAWNGSPCFPALKVLGIEWQEEVKVVEKPKTQVFVSEWFDSKSEPAKPAEKKVDSWKPPILVGNAGCIELRADPEKSGVTRLYNNGEYQADIHFTKNGIHMYPKTGKPSFYGFYCD